MSFTQNGWTVETRIYCDGMMPGSEWIECWSTDCTVRYGRGTFSAQPSSATCTVNLSGVPMDRIGDLLDSALAVEVRYTRQLEQYTTRRFTGRVTDAVVNLEDNTLRITGVDGSGALAQLRVGDTPWAQESVRARIINILTAHPSINDSFTEVWESVALTTDWQVVPGGPNNPDIGTMSIVGAEMRFHRFDTFGQDRTTYLEAVLPGDLIWADDTSHVVNAVSSQPGYVGYLSTPAAAMPAGMTTFTIGPTDVAAGETVLYASVSAGAMVLRWHKDQPLGGPSWPGWTPQPGDTVRITRANGNYSLWQGVDIATDGGTFWTWTVSFVSGSGDGSYAEPGESLAMAFASGDWPVDVGESTLNTRWPAMRPRDVDRQPLWRLLESTSQDTVSAVWVDRSGTITWRAAKYFTENETQQHTIRTCDLLLDAQASITSDTVRYVALDNEDGGSAGVGPDPDVPRLDRNVDVITSDLDALAAEYLRRLGPSPAADLSMPYYAWRLPALVWTTYAWADDATSPDIADAAAGFLPDHLDLILLDGDTPPLPSRYPGGPSSWTPGNMITGDDLGDGATVGTWTGLSLEEGGWELEVPGLSELGQTTTLATVTSQTVILTATLTPKTGTQHFTLSAGAPGATQKAGLTGEYAAGGFAWYTFGMWVHCEDPDATVQVGVRSVDSGSTVLDTVWSDAVPTTGGWQWLQRQVFTPEQTAAVQVACKYTGDGAYALHWDQPYLYPGQVVLLPPVDLQHGWPQRLVFLGCDETHLPDEIQVRMLVDDFDRLADAL